MIKLKFWSKEEGFFVPTGAYKTKEEILGEYPFTKLGYTVLTMMDGEDIPEKERRVGGIDSLSTLRQMHGVGAEVSPEDALSQIEHSLNNPPEPQPSVEERILAQLEYQSMMI